MMRAAMRIVVLAALLTGSTALGQGASLVEKAERDMRSLEYPSAIKALESALAAPGNDRATLLKIYELQGVCYATASQEAKALRAFQALLSLAPDHRLQGNFPPRVNTAYFEARSWVGQNGNLAAQALPAVVEPGKVKQL